LVLGIKSTLFLKPSIHPGVSHNVSTPTNNATDNLVLGCSFAGTLFLITALLRNVLVIASVPLADVLIYNVVQAFRADFGG